MTPDQFLFVICSGILAYLIASMLFNRKGGEEILNSRAIYREEGGKWLVKIVEDKSTETWEEYDIKILKQLRPARLEGNPAIGSIINIAGTKDVRYRHYVSWSLERIS